jgi:hypothetical protein
VSSGWPAGSTIATSSADSCSRNRAMATGRPPAGVSAKRSADSRVCVASSFASVSSVPRPRLRPASSAPSTLASNQVSMLRETNW